jgi:hypothetical protein
MKVVYSSRELFIIIRLRNHGYTLNEISDITGRSVNSLVYKFRDIRTRNKKLAKLLKAS